MILKYWRVYFSQPTSVVCESASLELIQMPEEAVSFVVTALKESHYDKKEYRDRVISQLRSELKKIESRLDAMYLDKLDGKVAVDFYDEKQREWRQEMEKICSKLSSIGMQMTVIWMKE